MSIAFLQRLLCWSMVIAPASLLANATGIRPDLLARNGAANVLIVLADQSRPLLTPLSPGMDYQSRRRALVDALRARADLQQAALRSWLEAQGVRFRPYWVANLIAARLTADQRAVLSSRADVARIEPDVPVRMRLSTPDANAAPAAVDLISWGVQKIGAADVWALGDTGQGVVIGDDDTGGQWDHPALQPHYRGWNGTTADHNYNWHDAIHDGDDGDPCPPNSAAPCDSFGHGTHTAGTLVGDDGGSNHIGIAPGAQWIGCRIGSSAADTYSVSRYIECMQWMLAPTDLNDENPNPDLAPDITNNSWDCEPQEGCPIGNEIAQAVGNLVDAGIFFVASATNDGPDCATIMQPPAIYDNVFTVGATDSSDQLGDFSSRGPGNGSGEGKPDISAPGVGIRSAYPPNTYVSMYGTSMAAPHVAGTAALVIAANPALRGHPDQIANILRATAATDGVTDPVDQACGGTSATQWPNDMLGYGRVDALAAVRMALSMRDAIFADGFDGTTP